MAYTDNGLLCLCSLLRPYGEHEVFTRCTQQLENWIAEEQPSEDLYSEDSYVSLENLKMRFLRSLVNSKLHELERGAMIPLLTC